MKKPTNAMPGRAKKPTRAVTPSRVESANAKVSDAQLALLEARNVLTAASEEDRAKAQIDVDAREAEVHAALEELEALDNASDTAGDVQEFMVASTIKLNGVRYGESDDVKLDRATFDQLKPSGAIVGEWQD